MYQVQYISSTAYQVQHIKYNISSTTYQVQHIKYSISSTIYQVQHMVLAVRMFEGKGERWMIRGFLGSIEVRIISLCLTFIIEVLRGGPKLQRSSGRCNPISRKIPSQLQRALGWGVCPAGRRTHLLISTPLDCRGLYG